MYQNTKGPHIPNCLRRHRKARSLSQRDVARFLGLKSASGISRWERGVCLPSTMNVFKLAAVYRVMADALYINLLRPIREEIRKAEEEALRRGR